MKSILILLMVSAGSINKISENEFIVKCKKESSACEERAKEFCKSSKVLAIDTAYEEKEKIFQKYSECKDPIMHMNPIDFLNPIGHPNPCGSQKSAWLGLKKMLSNDSVFRKDSIAFDRMLKKDSANRYMSVIYSCDTNFLKNEKSEMKVKEELEE